MSTALRTRWSAILFIVFCGMMGGAHVFKFSPALPLIRADLHLGLVAGGWVFSIVNMVAMLTGFAAGTFCDMAGRRRTLFLGLVALGLGSLMGSFAHSGEVMIMARVIEGFGFLAVAIAAPALINGEATNHDRNLALSLWGAYLPAGASLTLLIVPPLIAMLGWRMVWQLMAAMSFLLAAILLLYRPQMPDRFRGEGAVLVRTLSSLKQVLSVPGPRLGALAFSFYTFSFVSVTAWLPSYMIEHRGISAIVAGLLTAAVIAFNIVGNLAAGVFLHKGARYSTVILVTAVLMAGSALVIFSSALPDIARYGACLTYSMVGGMVPTTVFAAAPKMAPTPALLGSTYGLIVQGVNLGSMTGPPVVAAVAVAMGAWEPARWPLLAALSLLMLVALRIRRIETTS